MTRRFLAVVLSGVLCGCATGARIKPEPPEIVSFSVPADQMSLLVPELEAISDPAPATLESGAAEVNETCENATGGPCVQAIATASGGREIVFYRQDLSDQQAAAATVEAGGAVSTPSFKWLLDRTRGRSQEAGAGEGSPVVPHYLAERPNPVPEQMRAAERAEGGGREGLARGDFKWALRQVNYLAAEEALRQRLAQPGHSGGKVTIAHLDTGYTPNCQFGDKYHDGQKHEYPALDVAQSRDFFSNPFSSNGTDPLTPPTWVPESRQPGHGTRTASVIASPRTIGVCKPAQDDDRIWGSAPSGVVVIPVRVTDGIILGLPKSLKTLFPPLDHRVLSVSLGVEHVARRSSPYFKAPAQIISMSMGGESDPGSSRLQCVVDRAERNGVIVVAAAGQFPAPGILKWILFSGKQPVAFPARFKSTIAVAGSTILTTPWKDSCRGPEVDVTAPAEFVWRGNTECGVGESTGMGRGTSFATALTAGVVSMWVQYHGYDTLWKKYGRATTSALRWLLANKATRAPLEVAAALDKDPDPAVAPYRPLVHAAAAKHKWKSDQFGAGILDAKRLLDAELPTLEQVCRAEAARRTKAELAAICRADFSTPILDPEEGWETCAEEVRP